jgi:antirestriction protein ArdC
MKAEALMKKLEAHFAELKQALAEGDGEGLLDLLRKLGRFHRYSVHNVALIVAQKPEATMVAGLKRWNELGRRVKKGEKGIAILAPTLKQVEVVDKETGEVRKEQRIVGFHTAYVFDISQTEGAELEQPEGIPGGAELLERIKAACPVPVREGLLPGGVLGKTDGREVVLEADLKAAGKAEVLLHEWAHVVMHFGEERVSRDVAELEAEAVAYAVGRELGLPMESSAGYIRSWCHTVESLEASLERIRKAASEMLERVFATQPQAQAA